MSGLKEEKIPNIWVGLYMVLPLKRIRFWSDAPPLTLNPPEASPTDLTPGRVMTAFRMSPSPKAVGILEIVFILTFSIPISVVL